MHADADALFLSIYAGETPWAALPSATAKKRDALFADVQGDSLAAGALQQLLWHPALRQPLSTLEPLSPHLGVRAGNTFLDAALSIARAHADWQRDLTSWQYFETKSRYELLHSLVTHLFGNWPTPPFLTDAWLIPEDWRECYLRIAVGRRLKGIPLPIPLTERGRHFFLLAPQTLSLTAAARYGQVLSFGGSESLAQALIETKLGELQDNEAFWESVVLFLVQHPEISPSRLGPWVDFLHFQLQIEPRLSMRGRTPAALDARVEEWHAKLARQNVGPRKRWPGMNLPPFTLEEKDPSSNAALTWTVTEITDTQALQLEGSELRHCVRSYSGECARGAKAVFSVQLHASDSKATRRMLTVEVNRARRSVAQVRGKANCLPKEQSRLSRVRRAGQIVRVWARENRLGISATF